ncbi:MULTISPECIES: hypothetical protein [unclassified Fibrobacter]|uniref:hypothetical protein n=1 Tax=unclassified Fibrobacter TaxID=2634177 RepID=UPI000D6AC99C|nr:MULTISPECIES: hypothetical protein [unclassified Fibrobacter]PWJ63328.1 hypothetical protein BGX12_1184 [Fibrobacter sp. UWR4]PZW68262.1 hypothetical protein C8E88_10184 [Fibrobacter sp. UWR1]
MKIKSILLSLCLCSFAFAGPHSSDCVKKMVDFLKVEKFNEAFDAVLDNSPFIAGNVNVANVKMQYTNVFQNLSSQYGKPFNFQVLGSKTIGTLERTGFLVQCEKNAWVIELVEYNNPNTKKQYIVNFKILDENDAFNRYGV